MKKKRINTICRSRENFLKKSKKSLDNRVRLEYNLNVRRINGSGGLNLEKRTTKVKKPEIALS